MSEIPDIGAGAPKSAAARLFDLRSLIGGLFVLYGIMLTVAGFTTSDKDLAKASGININLWMGVGMLIIGAFFLAWWRPRPLQREQPPPRAVRYGRHRARRDRNRALTALGQARDRGRGGRPLSPHSSRRGSAGAGACWG